MIGLNTPSEIANLDDVAVFDQDVLRFNISVNQALLVQVIYSGADLNEEVESCVLTQILLFPN